MSRREDVNVSWSRPMSSAPEIGYLDSDVIPDIDREIFDLQARQYNAISISQPERSTINGIRVFKELLYDRKQPDTEIAEKVDASQQGTNKKRNELIEVSLLEDRERLSVYTEPLDNALERSYKRYLERRTPEDYGMAEDISEMLEGETYQKVMESHIFDEFSEDLGKISLRAGSPRRMGVFVAKMNRPGYTPSEISHLLKNSELPDSSEDLVKKDYQRWREAGLLEEDNNRPTWKSRTLYEFWDNHYEELEDLKENGPAQI